MISIQFDDGSRFPVLYIQIVLHYFEECPIPSGPFGFDANLVQLALDAGGIDDRSGISGESLKYDPERPDKLQDVVAGIGRTCRTIVEGWAQALTNDKMLKAAHMLSNECYKDGRYVMGFEQSIESLRKFGAHSSAGYPLAKIASQAYRRAGGDSKWSLV